MEDIFLMLGLVFVLFNFIKTFYFLRFTRQFEVIRKYFQLPEIILLIPFTVTVVNTFLALDNPWPKFVLTFLFLISLISGITGFKKKIKVAVVLAAMGYMYVFGICLTKNTNFMLP